MSLATSDDVYPYNLLRRQLYHLNIQSSKLREDRFELSVTCLALRRGGGVTTFVHSFASKFMNFCLDSSHARRREASQSLKTDLPYATCQNLFQRTTGRLPVSTMARAIEKGVILQAPSIRKTRTFRGSSTCTTLRTAPVG